MKKNFVSIIAIASLSIAAISCVDKQYDLKKLNTKITILPGLSVPIENGDVLDQDFNEFLSVKDIKNTVTGSAVVEGKKSENLDVELTSSALEAGVKIPISGAIVTNFNTNNEFLSLPGIGKVLVEPSVKVSVTNTCPVAMRFTAKVTDGTIEKDFEVEIPADKTCNVYVSENGKANFVATDENCIAVACKGFDTFFASYVPSKLTVNQMFLQPLTTKSSLDNATKGDRVYTAKLSSVGIVDLTFQPNAEFTYNTTVDVPKDFKIEDYNVAIGDEIVLNAKIEKVEIPFDITPTVTSLADSVQFSFEPATLLASSDSCAVVIKGLFFVEPTNVKNVSLAIKIKNPSSEVASITGEETIKLTIDSITTTNGVNL